jgi:hypothetical protein
VQRKSALSDLLKNKDKNSKKYKNMYLQSRNHEERYANKIHQLDIQKLVLNNCSGISRRPYKL